MWQSRFNLSWISVNISYHFVEFDFANDISSFFSIFQSLHANNCNVNFSCIFPNFLVRRANYQLQSFNHIYIYIYIYIYVVFFYISLIKLLYQLWNNICSFSFEACQSNPQFLAQRMQQMTVLFRERRCKLWCGSTKKFKVFIRWNHNCKHSI